MKKRNVLLSLIALPLFQASALDLTPHLIETTIAGYPKRLVRVQDAGRKYTLNIDRETEVASRSGGIKFAFQKLPDIDFLVMPSKFKPTDAFDEARLVEYRASARSLLPARAKSAEVVQELANPLNVNNWKSFRIKFHFTMDSRDCTQEVTFLNVTENDQIVLVTSSPEKVWKEAGARSWEIIRTWTEMLPGDDDPNSSN